MEKLFIKVAQSSQELFVSCKGKGLEPHIEFENSLLQFGPILPYTGRHEVSVKVSNPCAFPIEFYSLEFDKQYIEEEKVCLIFSSACFIPKYFFYPLIYVWRTFTKKDSTMSLHLSLKITFILMFRRYFYPPPSLVMVF